MTDKGKVAEILAAGGRVLLKGARIIDPASSLDHTGDLLISDGRIENPDPAPGAAEGVATLDLKGLWLVPGLIDMHVHLREPGQEHKEDIASGTMAAAVGGFTAVACMPNTTPVNDCQEVTAFILSRAEGAAARVYPVGCISRKNEGRDLAPYAEMKKAGAVAVSDDGRPVSDSGLMRRALEYSASFGMPMISHSEEISLSAGGSMNEGRLATRLGLAGIPAEAESIQVFRDAALAGLTGIPVHLAHISTAASVSVLRMAKDKGWPVTAETAPHYFTLTEEVVAAYDTNAKMNPPLRTESDRQAVIEAVSDGTIDVIATDHAPHAPHEKEVEFAAAPFGIIGLESALPLSLELVRQGHISPLRLIELMSTSPARILKVAGGGLAPGATADLTVIDPEVTYTFAADRIASKSSNSPFIGREMRGRAVMTIVGGRLSYCAEDFSCPLSHVI